MALAPTKNETSTTLADLRRVARASKVHELLVFSGTNLGKNTITARVSIAQFYEISVVANRETVNSPEFAGEFIAQRKLIPAHARALALYVLRGLVMSTISARQLEGEAISPEIYKIRDDLAGGPYAALQPLVCNVRACKYGGDDLPLSWAAEAGLQVYKLKLASSQKLWVVDGQHRREAFGMVIKFLEDVTKTSHYPRTKNALYNSNVGEHGDKLPDDVSTFWREVYDLALHECTVTVEIHLGLGLLEEGQLFSDLNSKGRTLHSSLLAQFDKSDAIAALVVERLTQGEAPTLRFPIKDESDAKTWTASGMTLKDVVTVNRYLVHGSNTAKATSPATVNEKYDFITRFWTVVQSIAGFGTEDQRSKTIAGQPVVLKALAKLAYDHAYGVPKLRDEEGLKTLYDAILSKRLTFSHSEPFWRALFMNDAERNAKFPGVNDFVFLGDQFKGGEYDENNEWVRFGPAHNDIVPRIGDLIRWKLGLKNRGAALKARGKAED